MLNWLVCWCEQSRFLQSGYCLSCCFCPFIPRQVRWKSVGCLFCWPACLLVLLLRQLTDKWLRCLFVLIKKLAHKGEKLCSLSALKLQQNSAFGATTAAAVKLGITTVILMYYVQLLHTEASTGCLRVRSAIATLVSQLQTDLHTFTFVNVGNSAASLEHNSRFLFLYQCWSLFLL